MLIALPIAFWLATAPADLGERTVTKASVYLAKSPSFLAPRSSKVALYRNDKVKLEAPPKGGWYLVSFVPRSGGAKQSGYLHLSYLSDRPIAFKVDNKEIEGRGQVSGNYNLAVPGFKPEVARARERSRKDAASGYRAIERYMPLEPTGSASPDPEALVAFVSDGRLREPAPEGSP